MSSYTIVRPLGISTPTDEEDLLGLRQVLDVFSDITFSIMRVSYRAVQVRIQRHGALPLWCSTVDEVVGGLIGDTLRLSHGETLSVNDANNQYVKMTFRSPPC